MDAHLARLAADLAMVAEVIAPMTRLAAILQVDPRTIARTLARGQMTRYMASRWLAPGHAPRSLAAGLRMGLTEREARRQIDMLSGPAWR